MLKSSNQPIGMFVGADTGGFSGPRNIRFAVEMPQSTSETWVLGVDSFNLGIEGLAWRLGKRIYTKPEERVSLFWGYGLGWREYDDWSGVTDTALVGTLEGGLAYYLTPNLRMDASLCHDIPISEEYEEGDHAWWGLSFWF